MQRILQSLAIIVAAGLVIFGMNRSNAVMAWAGVGILFATLCTI